MATFQKRGKRWRAIVRRRGHVESKSFDTKTAAAEWARRVESAADTSHVQEYKRPVRENTVAWMIREYTDTMTALAAKNKRIRPIGRNKAAVLHSLARDLGDLPLKDLDADRLNKYVSKRIAEGAGGVTIGIDLTYLKGVMRWLQAVKRIKVNVQAVQDARDTMKAMGLSTRSEERERRAEPDELDALFTLWESNPRQTIPMVDLVQFAIASAMRLGEICRIRWEDLDEEKKTVLIRDRKHPRKKIGNNQRVPLLDATGYNAFAIVKRQPRKSARIFPYSPDSVSTAFTRAVKKCGIEDLRFHDLRHEAVTRLFKSRKYSIPEVALVSGHEDWKMLKRYTQTQAEDLHR